MMTGTRAADVDPAMYINAGDTTVQLFFYAPNERDGLHVAYLRNDEQWIDIGQLISSDYSAWGSEKRMYNPNVARAKDGTWRAVFGVNNYSPCFAVAYSKDLITWRPQDYPRVSVKNVNHPIVFPMDDGTCDIYFRSDNGKRYVSSDKEFRHFSTDEASSIGDEAWSTDTATIGGKLHEGNDCEVKIGELRRLATWFGERAIDNQHNGESMKDDATRWATLQPLTATLDVDGSREKNISDRLVGIFFEDISYAADGGLYGELIENRDFEYAAADHKDWHALTSWKADKDIKIDTKQPLSTSNPHYAIMEGATTLINDGYDGIALSDNEYVCTFYARLIDCEKKQFNVALLDGEGNVVAKSSVKAKDKGNAMGWQRYEAVLTLPKNAVTTGSDGNPALASFSIAALKEGSVAVDMISLFPRHTFKNRRNGMRKDLAEAIAAMKPKFVRFPGGCMSHGQGLDNIYHWQHSIGELQDRTPDKNIWNYHQTRGLGFYEYFQFCEDLGAEPLPVLAAGVPCQNSAPDKDGYGGQQGGIDMKDMPAYCEEFLNLIEWANGDPATSTWAKKRAEAGHPAPFNLKMIGVGNEDLVSTAFEDRYLMICKAIKAKYPDMEVVGTVGPFHHPSSDYIEGWQVARDNKDVLDAVDEHYYESTGWFLNNQDYYDNYDRHEPKVYVGEYACHTSTRKSSIEAALAEAIHLTTCERNGDVVEMTSYAPLLSNVKHQNWHPDMIYFGQGWMRTTPTYETQRLFSVHSGDRYVASTISFASQQEKGVSQRVAASVVKDSKTGKTYLKLVNALPVQVTIDVRGLDIPSTATVESFSGKYDDEKVDTQQSTVDGSTPSRLTLKPYSLNVVTL